MEMEPVITGWILEFLARKSIPKLLLNKIISNPEIPIPQNNPRLKKTLILRSIHDQITSQSYEPILNSIETLLQLEKTNKTQILNSMIIAYKAIALDCTLKCVENKVEFFEVVKRIWRGRIEKLEELNDCELVTDELKEIKEEVEAALWDGNAINKLIDRGKNFDVLKCVETYLNDAFGQLGPSFLELAAKAEREMKDEQRKGVDTDGGKAESDANAGREDLPGRRDREWSTSKDLPVRKALDTDSVRAEGETNAGLEELPARTDRDNQKDDMLETHVQEPGGIMDSEMAQTNIPSPPVTTPDAAIVEEALNNSNSLELRGLVKDHQQKKDMLDTRSQETGGSVDSGRVATNMVISWISTPEVDKVKEALKSSSLELRALVKDPLPDALRQSEAVIAEMNKKDLNKKTPAETSTAEHHPSTSAAVSQAASRTLNPVPSETPNALVNQTENTNVEIPESSHRRVLPRKRCLMDRDQTARTFEWSDSVDGSPEASRFHLDSPKRNVVSPLNIHKDTKFVRRRPIKRWSIEEEDALREGVNKFGRGNWKLILNAYRETFVDRTEVDLKDKWRNLLK